MKKGIRFRVESRETDPLQITFYPNFFKWFDPGEIEAVVPPDGIRRLLLVCEHGKGNESSV